VHDSVLTGHRLVAGTHDDLFDDEIVGNFSEVRIDEWLFRH
jgi:hypothetical protein